MRPKLEPWIETFTGKKFDFSNPQPDMIDIADIAHALSLLCRYNGHCSQFYSVAEHSVLLARHVMEHGAYKPTDMLTMLLHDAAEAYIGDMPAPLKDMMPQFKELENQIEFVIAHKFKLYHPFPVYIKEFDLRILKDEKEQIMGVVEWGKQMAHVFPLGIKLQCWTPEQAERKFIQTFEHICTLISVGGNG